MSEQLRGFEQIIWNDTMRDPYSPKSIVRRLLVSGASDEFILALYDYTEEELDNLREEDEDIIYNVRKQIRKNEEHFKNRSMGRQVDHLMDDFFYTSR